MFFGPKFLDLHYKIQLVSDHMAKFHCDRPRELADFVAKQMTRSTLRQHRPSPNASIIELLNDFLQCKLAMQL